MVTTNQLSEKRAQLVEQLLDKLLKPTAYTTDSGYATTIRHSLAKIPSHGLDELLFLIDLHDEGIREQKSHG